MTKLQLWALTEYDQIMFYDSDVVFLQNPISAINACSTVDFCGVQDYGKQYNLRSYFNAGMMVISPNVTLFNDLMAHQGWAYNELYPEQDMLNKYYEGKWRQLPDAYNYMPGKTPPIDVLRLDSTITVHAKTFNLKRLFPQSHWVWNTFDSSYSDAGSNTSHRNSNIIGRSHTHPRNKITITTRT
jgi:alpha-N-acetylglucosamine transferase